MKIFASVLIIFGAIHIDAQNVNSLDLFDDFLPPHETNDIPSAGIHGNDVKSSVSSIGSKHRVGPIGGEIVVDTNNNVWRSRKIVGPKCPIDFEGQPPNCTGAKYILEPPILEKCPEGTYGVPPDCKEPCERYMVIAY